MKLNDVCYIFFCEMDGRTAGRTDGRMGARTTGRSVAPHEGRDIVYPLWAESKPKHLIIRNKMSSMVKSSTHKVKHKFTKQRGFLAAMLNRRMLTELNLLSMHQLPTPDSLAELAQTVAKKKKLPRVKGKGYQKGSVGKGLKSEADEGIFGEGASDECDASEDVSAEVASYSQRLISSCRRRMTIWSVSAFLSVRYQNSARNRSPNGF